MHSERQTNGITLFVPLRSGFISRCSLLATTATDKIPNPKPKPKYDSIMIVIVFSRRKDENIIAFATLC